MGEDFDFDEWVSPPSDIDLSDRGNADLLVPSAGAVRWEEVSGSERVELFEKLRGFVAWWCDTYTVTEKLVPKCWYRHQSIVEELTALMQARVACFSDSDQGLGPVGWHERSFMTRQRLEVLYRGNCASGHQSVQPRVWDGQDWNEFIGLQDGVEPFVLDAL